MRQDLIIRNGSVFDPIERTFTKRDVYVHAGKICREEEIQAPVIEFDADGYYVSAGWIDYHAHVFPHTTEIGIDTDSNFFPQGVCTAVDAGSSGVATARSFIENIVYRSEMRIYGLLNVCPTGMGTMKFHEDLDPKYWDEEGIQAMLTSYPAIWKGLKMRSSKGIAKELGSRPFYAMLKLAERLGVPVTVHTTDSPITLDEAASALRPGDTLAHCYHGTGNTILNEKGEVYPEVRDAQKRGVIIDAANGSNHWSFEVAQAGIEQGFLPDIISTDITVKTLYKDPVFSLPYVLSKYLLLGMKLEDILAACTYTPAKALGLADMLGRLEPGYEGDITVFKVKEKTIVFGDTQKRKRTGSQAIVPQMTVCRGSVVYKSIEAI